MTPHADPPGAHVRVTLCQSSHPCPSECPSPAGLVGGGGSEAQARKASGVSAEGSYTLAWGKGWCL